MSRRGTFMQVSQLVAQRYPYVEVVGSNYPIPKIRQAMANAVGMLRNVVIAAAVGGEHAANFFGVPVPAWYTANVVPNRMGWCFGAWFLGNAGSNALTQTHAFEIYANGELVFSKLATGRLPSIDEFWGGLAAALQTGSGHVGGRGHRKIDQPLGARPAPAASEEEDQDI